VSRTAIIGTEAGLIGYDEVGKMIALIRIEGDKGRLAGSLPVDFGSKMKEHWGQPVLAGGVLYLRHGDALVAYDLKSKP